MNYMLIGGGWLVASSIFGPLVGKVLRTSRLREEAFMRAEQKRLEALNRASGNGHLRRRIHVEPVRKEGR